ncbi:MAG: hypothetical protein QOC71_258, partial [Thermoplasmata archaeon]|nr:hypothetical protein [Thermoplasmata archaeon]
MLPFACRPLALAILATFAVAGCLGSGPDDVGGRATPSGPAECSAAQAPALDAQPPGLASHAAANQYDEAAGERTWRWDLVVDGACQLEATAHASVEVGTPPEYCAPPRLRA